MSRDDHASSLSSTMGGGAPRPGLSRRAFLRRAAAVAFAFPAAGTLLAACGGQSAPTPTSAPAGATAPAPAGTTAPPPATAAPAGQTASTATPAAARPAAAPGGQAVVSLGEPDTLLSGASRTALAGEIYTFTADGLARFRYPDMEAVPDLAEKWDVSPDGKTYTFALRQGVKWQDGQPFSAQDVKFSFETWAHPKWPGPLSPNLALIEGAAAYKQGQATAISGIAIPDDGHVRFTLTAAVATFLATSATGALLPRRLLQDVSPADVQKSPFARKPVYTGPFMVQSWQTGEGLTFAAFPDAFAGPPKLATLVGRDYPDQTTAINALRTGESQLGFVAPDQFDQFARDPTFRTQQLAGSQGVFLTFDLTNPLFADKRVRQAISHAIDRKALIAALFRGKADPSFGVASPLSWLYNPDAPRFDFDVAQAKQLLDAAGWQPGADGIRAKDGKKFSFTMDVVTGGAATQDVVALQPFLKAVGIEFQINELEFGTYIARHVVGKYEASYFSWANFIIDPREDLQVQFESPRAADDSGYDNAQVNQLFQQARAATSRDDEKKLYDQIQQITGDDAVYVYLWRPQPLLVARNTLALPTVKIPAELFARAAEWATSAER